MEHLYARAIGKCYTSEFAMGLFVTTGNSNSPSDDPRWCTYPRPAYMIVSNCLSCRFITRMLPTTVIGTIGCCLVTGAFSCCRWCFQFRWSGYCDIRKLNERNELTLLKSSGQYPWTASEITYSMAPTSRAVIGRWRAIP